MKLGPATKHDKRNTVTSNKIDDYVISANGDVIVFSPIYGQFAVIRKQPNSGSMVYKTYIFINSNFLSHKTWKQNSKIPNTALMLLLWAKVLFLRNRFLNYNMFFQIWTLKVTLNDIKCFKETRGWKSVCKSRAVFRTQSSICDAAFLQVSAIFAKSFNIDVRLGSKYVSE